eukprot:Rhum_TRINITY_DN1176_c0_g1::Rhum_TRINITY_DN1176_c0_g1_i1::g.3555::m.3555/K03025/RPC6, POLR3F; DNA-directed RNA polymerase III subunit RPC6
MEPNQVTSAMIEAKVVQMCQAAGPGGVPMDTLKAHFGKFPSFPTALQNLLYNKEKQKIEAFQRNGHYCYRLLGQNNQVMGDKLRRLLALNELEKRVYEAVKNMANRGLWSKELKQQLKQFGPETAITKAVKKLEKEQLIKSVKSVANRTRVVLMLYELDPDTSVTGGTWYNEDQEFDKEFVNILCRTVFQIVRDGDQVSIETIERNVSSMEVSRKALTMDDLQCIVNTLVYDGKLVETHTEAGGRYYQLATQLVDWHPFAESPCASCPIQQHCDSGGADPFNPQSCPYLKTWLEQGYDEDMRDS